ncbi:MAG TPA: BTAD domain-containing putative transcriptional regulator [Streptosporangiaceae bacterium]|nr:BTAD domain-containing putative transcriptional regulator [Streptosporangiaceae bacterium]
MTCNGRVTIDVSGGSVRFGLLGSLEVVDGSGIAWRVPAGKQRVILAALLLGRGRMVAAASLCEALWDGSLPPNESAVLRTYMTRLRRVLGPVGSRIVGHPPGWAIELRSPEEFDLMEVEQLRLAARAEASAGDWMRASTQLTAALSMWRGEPLLDVPSAALVRREAGMLAELRVALTEARIDADLHLGRHGELVAELRQLVAEHPLREHFRAQLMIACFGSGQQAAALEVYRDAYRTLADELGVEPSRELQEIHQRILSGSPTLAADPPAAVTVRPAMRSDPSDFGGGTLRDLAAYPYGVSGGHDNQAGLGSNQASWRAWSGSPGTWLRQARKDAGLTQRELAERSGLAIRTIRDLERGASARPYPRSIRVLAQALGLPQSQADELVARYRRADMPATVARQLPAAPRHFVGRRSELGLLARQLREMGAAGGIAISAISGMAGVGKTALALHWAHRVAGEFPDGQLYADLGGFGPSGGPVEPAVALRGFLDGLGVAAEGIPGSLQAQAGLYRSLVANRRMLIVLDNAYNVDQVRNLLPGSPGCLVLVTSRAGLAGLVVGGNAEVLALDVLSDDEARQLLAVRLGAGRVAAEPDAVSELIGLCARLPLAVAIAAARAAAHPGFPLAGLAAELRDAAGRLDGLDAGDRDADIRSVLSWSFQQLAERPARMFRLLAVHPGPGITAAAAASMAGIPLRQARSTLRSLADVNLITEYLPGRYALHDLLRAFAAEQAQAAGHADNHRAAVGRMLDHYLHTVNAAGLTRLCGLDPITLAAPYPGVVAETFAARDHALAWLDAERAVLTKITRLAADTRFDVHAWQLALNLAVYFRMRGHWRDLAATQRIGLAAAKRLGDQNAQASAYLWLATASSEAGRFRDAHAHLGRALQLYQRLGNHDGLARARISIGLAYSGQGRDRDALDNTYGALPTLAAGQPPRAKAISRTTQALALNNLGWYHARLGELEQARTRCEQALQLFRDVRNQYGQALTLDSLGYVYHQHGDHDRAVTCYQLAVDAYRQVGDLFQLAQTLIRLGDSCQAAADTTGARDAWQQAARILDAMHHPDAQQTQAKLRRLDSAA